MPHHVAPTLVEAVRQLRTIDTKGFVFVKPDGSERFCSFRTICDEAERRAGHLQQKGMKKGDRLAIVIPDGDEFVLSFLGAIFAGVVPVPIYPQLSFKNVEGYHDTVRHITKASGASMLLTTETTKPYVAPAFDRLATVDELAPPSQMKDVGIEPKDLCFLQFTSGSTSRPKGVMVTHDNLAWNAESFMIHGLAKDSSVDKGVSWLPLFHDMGLIGFVIGPLFTDIPVVFLPTASFVRSPRIWLDTLHKHRGTITYAPNFAYALVTKRLKDVAGLDLSCVKVAGCGAEPIQSKTLREFADKLAPAKFDPKAFLPSYGMAEATLAITFVKHSTGLRADSVDTNALRHGEAKAGQGDGSQEIVCCGAPFPEHEIAIVDEEGKRLPEGHVGQIITRGPSISPGYYEEPELTAQSFRDGWLYTGDLGYVKNGEIYICGRVKDIIIIRGRNYYPQDIEWAVSELPGVRRGNVVAFGVDVDGEEQLVVCAEGTSSEADKLVEQITACVASQIGLSVHKVAIAPQGSLPRTSSGKPQRRKTKQMFLDDTLPRARSVQGQEGEGRDGVQSGTAP